jgi:uncharacterized iron-regulated membrane protein
MTWLHTWTGLLLGWVLFAIFVTGTATYFRWEIQRWMQPEVPVAPAPLVAARTAVLHLQTHAPNAARWLVSLPDTRNPALTVFWQDPAAGRRFQRATLDPHTGEKLAARDTAGGEFFYRFHFQLQLPHPWGRYLAGVAALFMFLALISGIVTHRRFFRDFFLFRRGSPSLRSWRDFHNVTAVVALPFYLMISYSALVIFMALYMPWGQRVRPSDEPRPAAISRPVAGAAMLPSADFEPMLAEVTRRWDEAGPAIKRIDFSARGTERATVTFVRDSSASFSHHAREQLVFDGRTGALQPGKSTPTGPATAVHGYLYGLHLAHFAGPALRWAFFFMGMFGCALVATGLVMWTLKRRRQATTAGRVPFGYRLVERLNIATLAGLPLAIAALFWANRVLPVDLADRAGLEVNVFLATWALAAIHPWFRSPTPAWREQLWLGAALYALLPLLDLATTRAAHLAAWRRGDLTLIAFDATVLGVALLLAGAARALRSRATAEVPSAAATASAIDAPA